MLQRFLSNDEQIKAYMCGLIAKLGDSPTREAAESYTRRNHMFISPQDVIDAFGVKDWPDAIEEYKKYLYGLKRPRRVKNIQKVCSRQTLLPILAELYQEFDGNITKKKLDTRRKTKPTPDWRTLIKHLGEKSTWGEQVDEFKKASRETAK